MRQTLYPKSKKGMLVLTLAMLGIIIGFIAFLVISTEESAEREQEFIGENALAILRADQKAQLVLAYLDMTALFATREGLLMLAEQGGIVSDTPCGTYAGHSIWQAPVGDNQQIERCVPERIDGELSILISRLIDEHTRNLLVSDRTTYETYQFPINNYRIALRESGGLLDVIGNARNDLYFQVRRDRVVAYTPQADATGRGAEGAGENVIVGDYTIDPAFHVSIEYDLDDYEVLQDTVFGDDGLVARVDVCERRGDFLDACVRDSLGRLNQENEALDRTRITIVEGPCDPEENIKSDLIQGYLNCAASDDSACTCNVHLEQAPQNDQTPVRITLTKDRPAHVGRDASSQIDAIVTHAVRKLDATPVFSEQDEIQIDVPPEGKNITIYKKQDMIYYIQDESARGVRACTVRQRTYTFCARKEGVALWRLVDGRPVQQNPQYKFALTFPKITLPQVTDTPAETISLLP